MRSGRGPGSSGSSLVLSGALLVALLLPKGPQGPSEQVRIMGPLGSQRGPADSGALGSLPPTQKYLPSPLAVVIRVPPSHGAEKGLPHAHTLRGITTHQPSLPLLVLARSFIRETPNKGSVSPLPMH